MAATTNKYAGIESRGSGSRYRWTEKLTKVRQYGPTFPDRETAYDFKVWVLAQGRQVVDTDPRITADTWRLDPGVVIKASAPTVGQLIERYMKSSKVKPQTKKGYETIFRRVASVNEIPSDEMSKEAFDSLQSSLMDDYASTTVETTMNVLRAVFNWAVDSKILDSDPGQGYKFGKKAKRRRAHRYLEPIEYLAIRRGAEDEAVELMFDLMMHTGMRIGEMLALRPSQCYLNDTFPHILINRTLIANPRSFGSPKNGEDRIAPVSGDLLERLVARLKELGPKVALLFPSPVDPSETWTHAGFTDGPWKRAVETAIANGELSLREGKPTPHDLRHSYAALMLERHPINLVAKRLGHESALITAEVYSHVLSKMDVSDVGTIGSRMSDADAEWRRSRLAPVAR